MGKGWIKVHRQLLDNPMWLEEPFTKGQAWVDLLMLADGVNDGKYKRGTVYKSQKWLAERWGWSRNKVNRFLNRLEENHMVTVKRTYNGTQSGTTITLVKYGFFQDKWTPNETPNGTPNEAHKRSKEESLADADAPAKKEVKIIPWEEDFGLDPGEALRRYEEQLKNGNSV